MKAEQLKAILEAIYTKDATEKDLAAIVRQIHRRLDESFQEDAPSVQQQRTLKVLFDIADKIETFYKR